MQFLGEHYKWIFSGIGVFVLGGIIAVFKNRKSSSKNQNQSQRSGANSTNIQAGGNVEFTQKNDK